MAPMKARITFDIDFEQLGADDLAVATAVVQSQLINAARAYHKNGIQAARLNGDLSEEAKAVKLAEGVRSMMLTLMAQANMAVEALPDDAPISTELPFERAGA